MYLFQIRFLLLKVLNNRFLNSHEKCFKAKNGNGATVAYGSPKPLILVRILVPVPIDWLMC
jgi:hypothetical protein